MRLIPTALLATVLISTAAHATMMADKMADKTLYSRLGGRKAITLVVNDFIGNVAADKRINKFFAKANIPRLKRLLVEQICEGSGGPCTYTGRDMKSAHAGMGISGANFGALVEDLGKSLKKYKVPAKEQGELVAILAPTKKDIVEKP